MGFRHPRQPIVERSTAPADAGGARCCHPLLWRRCRPPLRGCGIAGCNVGSALPANVLVPSSGRTRAPVGLATGCTELTAPRTVEQLWSQVDSGVHDLSSWPQVPQQKKCYEQQACAGGAARKCRGVGARRWLSTMRLAPHFSKLYTCFHRVKDCTEHLCEAHKNTPEQNSAVWCRRKGPTNRLWDGLVR